MGKLIEALFGKEEKQPQAIPLRDAVLCMNCERVFEISQGSCPVCTSEVYLSVSLALSDDDTKRRVREMTEEATASFFEKHTYAEVTG